MQWVAQAFTFVDDPKATSTILIVKATSPLLSPWQVMQLNTKLHLHSSCHHVALLAQCVATHVSRR